MIETKAVTLLSGDELELGLYSRDGALGIGMFNIRTRDMEFVPLNRLDTIRRSNVSSFRFYNLYELPTGYADTSLMVRLHEQKDEQKKGLNRAEVLRPIPSSDPDFDELYKTKRAHAESLWSQLDASLYNRHARSIGHDRQEADLLGFALVVNSLTLARRRARERLKAVA